MRSRSLPSVAGRAARGAPLTFNVSHPMPRLFTYCIPVDDGAAPNPYWGVCTLAICKPVIRRTAKIGDWVVGTGSTSAPSGDLSGKIVYAMEVSSVMSLAEYDEWTRNHRREKIPDLQSQDLHRRVGDSIYDFSCNPANQRPSVHNEGNRETDLGGKNVLLSMNFYYFGNRPLPLPPHLQRIIHQTQGHKVNANAALVAPFLKWFKSQNFERNCLRGTPDRLGEVAALLLEHAKIRCGCSIDAEKAPLC